MPCFHPIPAAQDGHVVVLRPHLGLANTSVPCGNCLGCKTARAQEWALRCVHEARSHESSIFATLTYAPEHLPSGGALLPRDLALFIKRLRQAMARRRNHPPALPYGKLRYLATGEYGDIGGRPHYHAILFGVSLADQQQVRTGPYPLWSSPTLDKLWKYGSVTFGAVTAASAAYTASYTMKKVGEIHCNADGVVLEAPFLRCSLKPGLGANYADTYRTDFRSGAVISDGSPTRLPRYYKKRLEALDGGIAEDAAQAVYARNFQQRLRDPVGSAPERLVAAEIIAKQRQAVSDSHSL